LDKSLIGWFWKYAQEHTLVFISWMSETYKKGDKDFYGSFPRNKERDKLWIDDLIIH